jgi:hypothetical protein
MGGMHAVFLNSQYGRVCLHGRGVELSYEHAGGDVCFSGLVLGLASTMIIASAS